MTTKLKLLRVALESQQYDLAAHAIVYGMVKAKAEEQQRNGKKRSPARQPKRP
jgi:hypothetical protein